MYLFQEFRPRCSSYSFSYLRWTVCRKSSSHHFGAFGFNFLSGVDVAAGFKAVDCGLVSSLGCCCLVGVGFAELQDCLPHENRNSDAG